LRRTFVYDPDLDAMVEITNGTNRVLEPRSSDGVQIIRDLEPYKTVAGDVANGGDPIAVGGRRQHREFLQRNAYIEAGNELSYMGKKQESYVDRREYQRELVNDIKRAAKWL